VSLRRFIAFGFAAVIVAVLAIFVASLVDPTIGSTLLDRVLGQSRSIDVGDASSGRTALWKDVFDRMLDTPLSFLTGFGWDAYWVMPFRYAPHNYYVGMWFDLGVIGVGLFAAIVARASLAVLRAIPLADPQTRQQLLAFAFGVPILMVTIIFADLYKPWPYIWLYFGILLRMATLVRAEAVESAPAPAFAQVAVRPVGPPPLTGAWAGQRR
jgi:O-antigen ligase